MKKLLLLAAAISVALAVTVRQSMAMPSDCEFVFEERWTSPPRVLDFPTTVNLGTIETQPDWHTKIKAESKMFPARGKILVPKDQFISFHANGAFFAHPELIAKFPANAFDCLELKLMSMDDAEDTLPEKALAHIGHLKDLKILILDKSEISDEGMKKVTALTNLEYLSAFLAGLRGTCLKDLRSLKKLRALMLPSNGIKEDEFRWLAEYPSLQHLLLSHTNVSDKALKYIASCKKLKRLDLSRDPGVDDDGVQYLKQLKAMQDLSIDDTSITANGLLQLKGLDLTSMVLTENKYTPQQMSQVRKAFPRARIHFRGGPKHVDADTGTLFGPMSRQRHF